MRFWSFFLLAACAVRAAAQPQGGPPDPQKVPDFTLRFDVNLVQVDAVVTDSRGRYATDLQAGDFEAFQDGKRREIKYFTYVAASGNDAQTETAVPDRRLTRAEVKRTFLVFIDDIEMPFADFAFMRRALQGFVQREIRPGDLFAIMKVSGGPGVWQVFSSDPREIRAAVDHLSWLPPPAEFHSLSFFSRLRLAIRALSSVPGRKVLVLMNDEFPVMRFPEDLRDVAQAANYASVVIDAIDVRGLPVAEGMDNFADATQERVGDPHLADATQERVADPRFAAQTYRLNPHHLTQSARYFASQAVPESLTFNTGGLFLHDRNDIGGALRTVSQDARGYYLIGWDPGPEAFDGRGYPNLPYHRIALKVRRKGLTVRSRKGFYGMPQSYPRPRVSAKAQMESALFSPFRSGDLTVESRSSFESDPGSGPYVESQVHIAPGGIVFEDRPGGCSVVRLEVLTAAVSLLSSAPDPPMADSQMTSLELCGEGAARARRDGVVYELRNRVGRPGPYEMRVAVRNTASGDPPSVGPAVQTLTRRIDGAAPRIKIGSSIQFIEVPDWHKDEPALSGISLALDGEPAPGGAAVQTGGDVIFAQFRPAVPHDPAVRVFRPGERLAYSCRLLQRSAAGRPWRATMRVLFDGRELTAQRFAVNGDRIQGVWQLDRAAAPGRYLLQVELIAGPKSKPAARWIDFDLEP